MEAKNDREPFVNTTQEDVEEETVNQQNPPSPPKIPNYSHK